MSGFHTNYAVGNAVFIRKIKCVKTCADGCIAGIAVHRSGQFLCIYDVVNNDEANKAKNVFHRNDYKEQFLYTHLENEKMMVVLL